MNDKSSLDYLIEIIGKLYIEHKADGLYFEDYICHLAFLTSIRNLTKQK